MTGRFIHIIHQPKPHPNWNSIKLSHNKHKEGRWNYLKMSIFNCKVRTFKDRGKISINFDTLSTIMERIEHTWPIDQEYMFGWIIEKTSIYRSVDWITTMDYLYSIQNKSTEEVEKKSFCIRKSKWTSSFSLQNDKFTMFKILSKNPWTIPRHIESHNP